MNALATYLTTQLPTMLQFTERLVNQDSPATEPANIQHAVALVQAKMEALHMTVHQLNANHRPSSSGNFLGLYPVARSF